MSSKGRKLTSSSKKRKNQTLEPFPFVSGGPARHGLRGNEGLNTFKESPLNVQEGRINPVGKKRLDPGSERKTTREED